MENNIFAAFSFSGRTARKGAMIRAAEDESSALPAGVGAHPGPAIASHAGLAKSATTVKLENAVDSNSEVDHGGISRNARPGGNQNSEVDDGGISRNARPGGIQNSEVDDGGSSRNARPGGIQTSGGSQNYQSVAKVEKKEMVEEEPRAPPPQEMCEVKGENVVQQVKEENQEKVESLPMLNKKRQWNPSREEEKDGCEDIEDFGGGDDLRFRSTDSIVEKVKTIKMKRQNTKLTKGSRLGSSEVRPPPPHWEAAILSIRTMRTGRDAPVDLLGPAQLVDTNADQETQKFHVLVAAMISSQTRDAVTAAAMKRLHALPSGLTVHHLAESDVSMETLEELLKPVGFYRQKAKQLKSMAEILLKPPYCGRVPRTLDELMKLPGVGPKVGLLVLWVGFGMGEVGLIVDTNVRRVCCRLGWAPEGSSAEQVRYELESWLPKDQWAEASFLFVGFGQQVCKPIGPNCKECQLQNYCPSAFKCGKKVISKKRESGTD